MSFRANDYTPSTDSIIPRKRDAHGFCEKQKQKCNHNCFLFSQKKRFFFLSFLSFRQRMWVAKKRHAGVYVGACQGGWEYDAKLWGTLPHRTFCCKTTFSQKKRFFCFLLFGGRGQLSDGGKGVFFVGVRVGVCWGEGNMRESYEGTPAWTVVKTLVVIVMMKFFLNFFLFWKREPLKVTQRSFIQSVHRPATIGGRHVSVKSIETMNAIDSAKAGNNCKGTLN